MKKGIVGSLLFSFLVILFSNGCSYTTTEEFHFSKTTNKEVVQVFPKFTDIPETGSQSEITLSENIPIVEGYINGSGPYRFVVDTGVTGMMVSSRLAEELGLKISSNNIDIILQTPTGDENLGRTVEVEKLTIGNAVFGQLEAARLQTNIVKQTNKADGILGLGVFKNCVVEIDYVKKYLKITKTNDSSMITSENVIPAKFSDRGIFIESKIENEKLEFMLDTGISMGISVSKEYQKNFKIRNKKKTWYTTLASTQKITKATLDGDISFGNILIEKPVVYIHYRNLLGGEVLKNYILKIDQQKKYVSINYPSNN